MSPPAEDPVGLIPAAGTASRLGPIPCSKEVFPLGFRRGAREDRLRPRVAADDLLGSMRKAGAERAFVVIRTGKWDIPVFLEEGDRVGPDLAYLVTGGTAGVPFTLARAVPFLGESPVLFGFPDILFEPADALELMLARQRQGGADVVLGLFPASRPKKMDMVRTGDGDRVEALVIKPERTDLRYTWILAAWTSRFTAYLSRWCREADRDRPDGEAPARGGEGGEPYLGHVIQDAVDSGMAVDSVRFDGGRYVDIGTPEELVTTTRRMAGEAGAPPSGATRPEGRGGAARGPKRRGE